MLGNFYHHSCYKSYTTSLLKTQQHSRANPGTSGCGGSHYEEK